MARELDNFEWGDGVPGSGIPAYDWERWLNRDIWEIRKGVDYDVPTENMRVNLHSKADQHRLKVRTRKVPRRGDPEHGQWEGLVFQYYRPSAEDADGKQSSRSAHHEGH